MQNDTQLAWGLPSRAPLQPELQEPQIIAGSLDSVPKSKAIIIAVSLAGLVVFAGVAFGLHSWLATSDENRVRDIPVKNLPTGGGEPSDKDLKVTGSSQTDGSLGTATASPQASGSIPRVATASSSSIGLSGSSGGESQVIIDDDDDPTTLTISPITVELGQLSEADVVFAKVAENISSISCVIIGGDPNMHFTVDNSCNLRLTSNGVGQISGTYNLEIAVANSTSSGTAAVTVNIIPNRYDVNNDTQLTTVLSGNSMLLSGKTVALHPGNYGTRTISKAGLTATLTLKAARSTKPVMDALRIGGGTSNLTLDGIYFQMSAWPSTQSGLVYITGGSSNLTIRNSVFRHGYGTNHDEFDPTRDDYPEYTAGPGERMLSKLTSGIARDGSGQINNLTIEDNTFTDMGDAIKLRVDAGTINIVGNTIARIYQDFISIGINQNAPSATNIRWNVMSQPFSKTTDGGNPHSDFMQFFGNDNNAPFTSVDWPNIRIEGNISFIGMYNGQAARGQAQGIPYMDDMPGPPYFDAPVIAGNVNLSRVTPHGGTIALARDAYVFGNTSVRFDPTDSANASVQRISGGVQGVGYHGVLNNVTEAVIQHATLVDNGNVLLGRNGATIAYSTAFAGSSFSPSTIAEILARYAPKSGGPLSTGVIGAIGNGYVDFINRTIDYTKEVSFVQFTNLTGQTADTLVTSDTSRVRGGVDGRDISITGDGSPQYRICADRDCNTVIADWSNAASTVNPSQFVQIRLMTSANPATARTATITIGGTSYNFAATTQ